MPRDITITFSDGTKHQYNNTPDSVTPDDIEKRAKKDYPTKKISNINGGKKKPAGDPLSADPISANARPKGSAEPEQVKKKDDTPSSPSLELIPTSEPNVKFYLLDLKTNSKGNLIAKTKRVGKGGTSTAVREFDCTNELWKYLEDDGVPVQEPKMSGFVKGSSSWEIFQYCCKKNNSKAPTATPPAIPAVASAVPSANNTSDKNNNELNQIKRNAGISSISNEQVFALQRINQIMPMASRAMSAGDSRTACSYISQLKHIALQAGLDDFYKDYLEMERKCNRM